METEKERDGEKHDELVDAHDVLRQPYLKFAPSNHAFIFLAVI